MENIPEKCPQCKLVSLESGCSLKQSEDGSVKYSCLPCAYDEDCTEQIKTGILRGSLSCKALIKQDWKIFKPFFELEVLMTPIFQKIWDKYKNHETLNDSEFKKALLIDLNSGSIFSRKWGESNDKFLKTVASNSVIIEIFDGMCGYIGIDLYSAHSNHGMWIQGQLRSKDSSAMYRSCFATLKYAKELSSIIEERLNFSKEKMASDRSFFRYELGMAYNLPRKEFYY